MEVKDLLDIDKMKVLEQECLELSYQVRKRRIYSHVKAISPRLGSDFWKKHSRWKRHQELGKEKRAKKRKYANRCPKRYEVYIKSPWWTDRKNKFYQKHGRACAVCGLSNFLNLHHIWYGDFGNETDEQLLSLCRFHHQEFHKRYGAGTNDFRKQTAEFLASYKTEKHENTI